ncbi:TetR/AcrR family transcriptional regulator [Kitasatospora kifunensis]|uniref:AcrR family transcriptional regulator n=1 Tax=Kitasatospora kifunensis TaxID=58351 RepID=A0A7W7RAL5_KITKI|nr:TetR family transcriptional regulator [Kitasatospora kifunensis]MBB4928462.1 AcrR family transcriptional regulator [Kitasatospora kifunensis]
MTTPQFERARSAEAKHARVTAILEAAARLAGERGVRAVTVTDIAAAVGMHKSAMLRYFETREEIFLRLAAGEWVQWSQDVRNRLGALDDGRPAGPETPIAIAGILADSLVARPLFCDLLAHTPLNLERGVSFAAVRSFKLIAIAEVGAVSAVLCGILNLTDEQGGNVVATAVSMAGALWQMAAPGTELRRFYQDSPELAHALVDVAPKLTDILAALMRGYGSK